MAVMMAVRHASRFPLKPQVVLVRQLCVGTPHSTSKSSDQSDDMKILKASIKKTIEKNPDIVATPTDQDSAGKAGGASNLFEGTSFLADYDKLQLSKENIMVDTYALIKVFREKGFTLEQAECIAYTYTHLMIDALREQRKHCVDKAALDVMREQVMAHIQALRKDMIILEKSELSDLRNENEKLKHLLQQHKSLMAEDISKVRNQLTLDINFERSRAKDEYIQVEKNIANLTTKMTAEVGSMETTLERHKYEILKYIGGSLVSIGIFSLGIYVRKNWL